MGRACTPRMPPAHSAVPPRHTTPISAGRAHRRHRAGRFAALTIPAIYSRKRKAYGEQATGAAGDRHDAALVDGALCVLLDAELSPGIRASPGTHGAGAGGGCGRHRRYRAPRPGRVGCGQAALRGADRRDAHGAPGHGRAARPCAVVRRGVHCRTAAPDQARSGDRACFRGRARVRSRKCGTAQEWPMKASK
jgi:hypothetical protein